LGRMGNGSPDRCRASEGTDVGMRVLDPSVDFVRDDDGFICDTVCSAGFDHRLAGSASDEYLSELRGACALPWGRGSRTRAQWPPHCLSYPSEYAGPRPIAEQVLALSELFDIGCEETMRFVERELPRFALPDIAEGWFAAPSLDALSERHFPSVLDPVARYRRAVALVVEILGDQHYLSRGIGSGARVLGCLKPDEGYARRFAALGRYQAGGIWIFPAQFGARHRAKSALLACRTSRRDEYGLGFYVVACMLATHRARLTEHEQIGAFCPGDEVEHDRAEESLHIPGFSHVPAWFCDNPPTQEQVRNARSWREIPRGPRRPELGIWQVDACAASFEIACVTAFDLPPPLPV
jgi:hypothetical protein